MGDYAGDSYPYAKFHHDKITPLCKCLHSASGLAVLFRPPTGSGHIGPHYLSPAKTVRPVWPRPVSALSYLRKWHVIGGAVQGKIILFS